MTRLLCRSCRDTPSESSLLKIAKLIFKGKKTTVFEVAAEISLHAAQVCFNPPCPLTDSLRTTAGGVSETHTHTHISLHTSIHYGNADHLQCFFSPSKLLSDLVDKIQTLL